MNLRPLALTAGLALLLSGCLVAPPPGSVLVVRRPPPPRFEVITVRPGPEYTWVRGYWTWGGNDYVWVGGRWDRPTRPTVTEDRRGMRDRGDHGRRPAKWQDGRWKHVRGGCVWQPGHWDR